LERSRVQKRIRPMPLVVSGKAEEAALTWLHLITTLDPAAIPACLLPFIP